LKFTNDKNMPFQEPRYSDWDWHVQKVVGQLDTAFDGDHYCALTFMAQRGPVIQAVGFTYQGNVRDWYSEIAELTRRYRVDRLWVEDNADKGGTSAALSAMGVKVRPYHEDMNKGVKISQELYRAWPMIEWASEMKEIESQMEYMSQIVDWKLGSEPDDAPDSAASLVRKENLAPDRKVAVDPLYAL